MGRSTKDEPTFDDGYLDGWASIAGDAPLPPDPKPPPAGKLATYGAGYAYGRVDALERFRPLGTSNETAGR